MAYYTTVKKVYELLNLFTIVRSEAVGTGNSTTKVWNLVNTRVVDGTLEVYLAGVLQTETTNYTVDYTNGVITFVTAPGVVAITANYWYGDVASSVVTDCINRAEDEIDRKIGRGFYTTASITENYDGNAMLDSNMWAFQPQDFRTEMESYKDSQESFYRYKTLFLNKYPVTSITSLYATLSDGSTSSFSTSSDIYLYGDEGRILIKYNTTGTNKRFDRGQQNFTVTYVYGYTTVPKTIENLATKLAAFYTLESRLMGSPVPLDVDRSNMKVLMEDVERLFDTIGRKLEMKIV